MVRKLTSSFIHRKNIEIILAVLFSNKINQVLIIPSVTFSYSLSIIVKMMEINSGQDCTFHRAEPLHVAPKLALSLCRPVSEYSEKDAYI